MRVQYILAFLLTGIAAILFMNNGHSQTPFLPGASPYPEHEPPQVEYRQDYWPKRPFFIGILYADANYPPQGYPLNFGCIKGVSDTLMAWIEFDNQSGSAFSLTGQTPQDWVTPRLYNTWTDVKTSPLYADTSDFDCAFQYWSDGRFYKKTAPTVLDTSGNYKPSYTLTYYLWNLPIGTFRLVMEETASAPSGFRMIEGWGHNIVVVAEPKVLADTLNAFVSCFWRARYQYNYSAMMSWADSIIAYNPKSIAGYRLKSAAATYVDNTTLQLSCLDSVITFCQNYEDPVLPDSAHMSQNEALWMTNMKSQSEVIKHYTQNPPGRIIGIQ